MALSKTLRFQVMRRDSFTCQYCGGRPPDASLCIDHVVPAALGGADHPSNLLTSCSDCNSGKAATPPDAEQVAQVAESNRAFADAMAQLAKEAHEPPPETDRFFAEWARWRRHRDDDPIRLPANWHQSVLVWLDRGLVHEDFRMAIERSMRTPHVADGEKFRYMAGICWNILRERTEQAAGRIGDDR